MINYPALLSALCALAFSLALFIVWNLEDMGYAAASLRVVLFCCVALVSIIVCVVCVLTRGGGLL
jgi:hypothetical protein